MKTPVAIYKIQNAINGKLYIGQTVNPKRRAKMHFWKNNGCVKLKNAIEFYGRDAFIFSVLCWCEDKADANEVETLLIALADTRTKGYNITPGGYGTGAGADNPFFGKRHSAELKAHFAAIKRGVLPSKEVRERMSAAQKGHTVTDVTRAKLRDRPKSDLCSTNTAEANRTRVWTNEAREKLAAHNRGKRMSDEARAKIADANKRRVWSAESRTKLSVAKTKPLGSTA